MGNIQTLVDRFVQHQGYLAKGAGYLSKQFDVDKKDIYKAKERAREIIYNNESTQLQMVIAEQEEEIARLVSSKDEPDTDGFIKSSTNVFESTRILTQAEIKELAGIDDITCRLGMVWKKLQTNGRWTYSIQVIYMIKDFYSKEELSVKLKEVFPEEVTPFEIPKVNHFDRGTAAFVYIGDDHVGLNYNESLFGNQYSGDIYEQRMRQLAANILNIKFPVEHLYIVRLGDEADGYNGKTTRYDHDLGSQSNKEQFDIYTYVNKKFYDTVFSSGKAKNYTVINCNNSNHTGLGFSYILNKAVEFYLEAKFPEVEFRNVDKFIDFIEWGNHVIGISHGKDEKFMKAPMPLNLDQKTDLYLYDLYDKKGYSPNQRWISTMKADIHKYNVNEGKSGRYVNVPSIAGGSRWIEHNFGNTKPGALIEYYMKEDNTILSIPVRF